MTATPTASASVDLVSLEQQLRAKVRGEVSFDTVTRGLHATDASHYQVMPACVVWPVDADDAATAVGIAGSFGLPITPRGAATSLSGQTTWTGMVLDCSRHMDKLLELNADEQWARVGPGIIRDQLNKQLAPHGLHFSPDPATGDRATLGGMIGNNSSGTHSLLHGKTSDNVLEVTVALADGSVLKLGPEDLQTYKTLSEGEGNQAHIRRGLKQIIDANRDEIIARYPKVMRRVSGYNLDAYLVDHSTSPWNLATLIVGSEGTLGVLLEAKVKLTPLPKATSVCVVHFDDLRQSFESVVKMLEHKPAAVEMLDGGILAEAKRNRASAELAADFLEGEPAAVMVVEFWGDTVENVRQRADALAKDMQAQGRGYAWPVRTEPDRIAKVWQVRKLSLGLASNVPGPRKRQAFIEDACVPVEVLADYIMAILDFCKEHDAPVSLYGHASVGVIHVEPMLDLHKAEEVQKMKAMSEFTFELVKKYGGSWSGEHGDGLVRGEYLQRFFGPQIYSAFRQVKALFDPKGLMNPGKIIDPPPMTENLRYGKNYRLAEVPSTFNYRDQGGFAMAVEQCNGVGACRKIGSGTMCPSYMATRDEEHVTRGRANALRLAMSNQLEPDAMTSDRLKEVLDLCLECKACKAECPNSVDMSRLKSDVLQMRHDKHGAPLGTRVLAAMPTFAPLLAGPWAPLINWVQGLSINKWFAEKLAGIDRRRTLPTFASQSLRKWFDKRKKPTTATDKRVVLFDDTYANYFEPHIGKAAVELLESCGYEVILAKAGCCQRPRISKGMLHDAKRDGSVTMANLDAYVKQGLTIVTLEPSCVSSLADDLPDLIDDVAMGKRVADSVKMIDVFIAQEIAAGRIDKRFTSPFNKLLLHGHCHQKALVGTGAMKQVLSKVDGLEFSEVDSGCCGMAGSFGYENFELSQKIGEERLFPAIRNAADQTTPVACGFSCRHQVHDGVGVTPKHWVEVVKAE